MTEQEYTLNCDNCGIPYKSKEGFPSPQICPACRQKRLDIPELREKIARVICCFAKDNNSCAECKENIPPNLVFPDCFHDIREETDQLLALYPDIEEAKKQVLQKLKDDNFIKTRGWSMGVCNDIEQALKENDGR